MLSCLNQINLVRYLIVWRVNSSLSYFPRFFSLDLSQILGTIISRRLPTGEKKKWEKSLAPLNNFIDKISTNKRIDHSSKIPETAWPLSSVLFVHPLKRTYGKDEFIFWELKLFGEHADHGLFLEVILPAMEEASYTSEKDWNRRNRIWGHFDIQNIYTARGEKWEPIVADGKLNLGSRVHPTQWLEGLTVSPKTRRQFKILNWITPSDLNENLTSFYALNLPDEKEKMKFGKTPLLSFILHSLIQRINKLLYQPSKGYTEINEILNVSDRSAFLQAFQQSLQVKITKNDFKRVHSNYPGKIIGAQEFSHIPREIVPYLDIASILHLGSKTHFGCGTFDLR